MNNTETPTGLPRTVSSPDMGVTVTFLVASDETGGDHVESQVRIPPGEPGPPRHYHIDFEETFTVIEGELTMDLGVQRGIVLRPGEQVHVPRGVGHRYYNTGDRAAVFHFRAAPGQAYEHGIRAGFGLSHDGRTDARGVPRNPLEAALMIALSRSFVAGVPHWLQRALTVVGVGLARPCGYDPQFSKYTQGPRS
jgi:quercetin dioxygenase-like cupin family protein